MNSGGSAAGPFIVSGLLILLLLLAKGCGEKEESKLFRYISGNRKNLITNHNQRGYTNEIQ